MFFLFSLLQSISQDVRKYALKVQMINERNLLYCCVVRCRMGRIGVLPHKGMHVV
jgi:hypothetical protein